MTVLLPAALLPPMLVIISAAVKQMPFAPKAKQSRRAVSAGPATNVPAQTFPHLARYQNHAMNHTLPLLAALLIAKFP